MYKHSLQAKLPLPFRKQAYLLQLSKSRLKDRGFYFEQIKLVFVVSSKQLYMIYLEKSL